MLGKKQSISNDDWINALPVIKNLISEDEVKKIEEQALSDILEKTRGKKAAYSWSGGKDSMVIGSLCNKVGITDCMLAICNLEYPSFMQWVRENQPLGLTIINTGQDMEWLVRHPDMLFPDIYKNDLLRSKKATANAARWFAIVQHSAQTQYFKNCHLDILILGRRCAEGNYIGKGSNIYTNGKGTTRFSPIAYWNHEQVLGYIAYNELPLPPIYNWPNGFKNGTHPWPARPWTGSIENAWHEVYTIDPSIVKDAAMHFESAKLYMEGLE